MVKRLAKYVEKLKKLTSFCKRKVKQEFRIWKTFSLNLVINILINLLSKRRGSSVTNTSHFTLPSSASFLNFLRVWVSMNELQLTQLSTSQKNKTNKQFSWNYSNCIFRLRNRCPPWRRRPAGSGRWPPWCCWPYQSSPPSPASSPGCLVPPMSGISSSSTPALFTLQYTPTG